MFACPMFDPSFERTALPDGPRVISARLPGSRSLSVAVYVLAGSRLESRRAVGRGPLHGARDLQGHQRLPDDEAPVRGDRGLRRIDQRGHGSRVDRLLGAAAGARVRPSFRRPVGARLPAAAASERHRPRARHHRRGDPLLPRRSGPVRLQPVRHAPSSATRRSAGRSPATKRACAVCAESDIRGFWSDTYRPGEHGHLGGRRRRPRAHRREGHLAASAPATASSPASAPHRRSPSSG